MSATLTKAYIDGWLNTTLGGSKRTVELQPADYNTIYADALRRYNSVKQRRIPKIRQNVETTWGQNQGYQISVSPQAVGIEHVYFLMTVESTDALDVFELQRMGLGSGLVRLTTNIVRGLIDILLTRMWHETYLRVRGGEPDWEFDFDSHKLTLYGPAGPYDIGYIELWHHASPATIDAEDDGLFLRIALRYAKEILGRIRGKFGNKIPGPSGETELDGETLLREAAEEEKALVELLGGVRRNPLPTIG